MNKKITLLAIFVALILISCEKEKGQINTETNGLTGNWINPQYDDTLVTFERSNSLKEDGYGFSIKENRRFIERKNSGQCGTPPISYADYEGCWEQNGSIININVGYWGGIVHYSWEIISVDAIQLTIIQLQNHSCIRGKIIKG